KSKPGEDAGSTRARRARVRPRTMHGAAWQRPGECERRGRWPLNELLLREKVDDLLGRAAVVLDLHRVAARGRLVEREHLRARPRLPHFSRVQAEVRERERRLLLLLRAH